MLFQPLPKVNVTADALHFPKNLMFSDSMAILLTQYLKPILSIVNAHHCQYYKDSTSSVLNGHVFEQYNGTDITDAVYTRPLVDNWMLSRAIGSFYSNV